MSIKIKKVEIKNFKLFHNIRINLDDPSLIVFDGPNGFGKTSFFDAIELLFTGKIRRYHDLANQIIDKRETFKENSFLNNETDGDLIIKVEIDINGNKKCLMRKGKRSVLNSVTLIQDFKLDLYELSNFNEDEGTAVEDECQYLTQLLSENYCENFEFLNYIEQEEHAYLLKNKDKARKEAIGYLFNTLDFESIIEKITIAHSKIGQLCGKQEEDKIQQINKELSDLEKNIIKEAEEVEYLRLIEWSDYDWDQAEVEFTGGRYAEIIGENGVLEKLKDFVLNIDAFNKFNQNVKIDKLTKNEDVLKQLLLYIKFIDKCDEYYHKQEELKEIQVFQKEFQKGILQAVIGGNINLSKTRHLLSSKIDMSAYDSAIKGIQQLHKKMGVFSDLVASLKDSRNTFLSNFQKYEKEAGEKKDCPLCGFQWESIEKFKEQVSDQTDQVNKLIKEFAKEIDEAVTGFEKTYMVPIQEILNQHIETNKIDPEFIKGLREAQKNISLLRKLYEQMKSIGVNIDSFLNTSPSIKVDLQIKQLKEKFDSLKEKVDSEQIKDYFPDIFLKYFNEKIDSIGKVSSRDIEKKKKYLRWKYALYQSETLKNKKTACEKQKARLENAKKVKEKILDLKKIYESSLKEYQKQLIGDIEILFHIYSGRIIQDYQGGLGLFIFDKNGIRFLENPDKSHDAIFSMSSGQISALIIAFTLTLNKKYSKNRLLFIDDPVQTLDELNIAGLVELLRNEFHDRQIFISTHEDKMSAYIRYKFEKFGLKTQRVSFKDKYFDKV